MTEPTDDELDTLIDEVAGLDSSDEAFREFARAVLAKWGTPAQKTNQCGEVCERAKLCAICAGGLEDAHAQAGAVPPIDWSKRARELQDAFNDPCLPEHSGIGIKGGQHGL